MNDLEVCRRIADIEDVHYMETKYHDEVNFLGLVSASDGSGTPPELIGEYNPLTDDALCFQLMIRHKVILQWLGDAHDGTPHYMAYVGNEEYERCSTKPNEAILLTIIAKTKGK